MSRIEKALEKASLMRSRSDATARPRQSVDHWHRRSALQPPEPLHDVDPHLITHSDAAAIVSEEYKKLKAMIIKITKQESFKNMLLVTSAVGGEGKSITAANLALSLAQDYDHSVLLIDADLRKPMLHRLFNVTPDSGLSDCVSDEKNIASALIKIGSGNLMFLPSGKQNENPVELFSSQRMEKALSAMKYRYPDRYIIIDTPPVLLFAEAKLISTLVDGIIFVVKEGRASQQHITEALDSLKAENVMGIVYNAVGTDGLNNRYSYHAYYTDYQK